MSGRPFLSHNPTPPTVAKCAFASYMYQVLPQKMIIFSFQICRPVAAMVVIGHSGMGLIAGTKFTELFLCFKKAMFDWSFRRVIRKEWH